jgi:hypothetical protein
MIVSGLDLGKAQHPSALAVVETLEGPDPLRPACRAWVHCVRYLHLWALGTPYFSPAGAGVCEDLAARFAAAPLKGSTLVVDATGVGMVTVDAFRARGLACAVVGLTITAGEHGGQVHGEGLDWKVPKAELVGTFRQVLLPGRLRVARVAHADRLRREMESFSEQVTKAGNVVYDTGEGPGHADLLFALMLAVWWGERNPPFGAADVRQGGRRLTAGFGPGGW